MKNNVEHRQLWHWNFRLLLALTGLLFSHQLFSQSCAYSDTELEDAIENLTAVPSVDGDGLVAGTTATYYFVSGPPICSYNVSAEAIMYFSAYSLCDECSYYWDYSKVELFRLNGDQYEPVGNATIIQGDEADGYAYGTFDCTVRGGDIIALTYVANGDVYDYDLPYGDQLGSGIGFSSVDVTENPPGIAASITVCPAALPADSQWEFSLDLTETNTFFVPQWEFSETPPDGWTIDKDDGVLTPSADAVAGTLQVKCYEGMSLSPMDPPGREINFPPTGTANDYIEKTITAVVTPYPAGRPRLVFVTGS